jgi:hypothetical protein
MNTGKWVRRSIAVLAGGVALALVSTATPAAAATLHVRAVFSVLTGANSVPPIESKGIAVAAAIIDANKDTVCYFMAEANLVDVTLAHIHVGAAGTNGGVVVPLTAPVNGTSSGCVQIADPLADDLVANPQNYYFNIHTVAHPAGEIRGQLAKG